MRVTAGTARGKPLTAPVGGTTRPTSSKVRDAILNSLHSIGAVIGVRVLDLYAGTGALGIEALSRGADVAVFVENHPGAVAALRSNLCVTGLAERAGIMEVDVWAALEQMNRDGRSFDVAMADPPYAFGHWVELLERTPADLVVAQSDRRIEECSGWEVSRCKRYGRTVVTFLATQRSWDTTPQAPGFDQSEAAGDP